MYCEELIKAREAIEYKKACEEYARLLKLTGGSDIIKEWSEDKHPRGEDGRFVTSGGSDEENERISKEIASCGFIGEVHYPAKKITASNLPFDVEHTQKKHNVTEAEAREFVKNAKFSLTRWNGRFENYFAENGAAYVNTENNEIRTAYKKDEFTENVRNAMEVLKRHEK